MQQGDYTSSPYYNHPQYPPPIQNSNPNPNPIDHQNYASAPPYSTSYCGDFTDFLTPPPPPTATTTPPSSFPQPSSPYDLQGSYPGSSNQPPHLNAWKDQPHTTTNYTPSSNNNFSEWHDQPQRTTNYESPHTAPNYAQLQPPPPPMDPNVSAGYSPAAYNPITSAFPAGYDTAPYDNNNPVKLEQGPGYFDGGFNHGGRFDYGSDPYGKRADDDSGYGDGVYAYQGGKVEPYGARGTAPKSSTWAMFDDYGRAINFPSGKDSSSGAGSASSRIVRAEPKLEAQQDVKSGVHKFRVKLLAESGGQSTMDVLCQVGLDGIRMLDPSTSRTLRIYPLEAITRCEVFDSSTLAFWSKSIVDVEPRRIRLQSNSYTTNTLLDIMTAATVQFKEMGGRSKPADVSKATEQPTDKKKGLGDWINLIKPPNEEKDHWMPDEAVSNCTACGTEFSAFVRRHHCRNCGDIFCDKCTHGRIALTAEENAQPVRVCDRCMAEVTQRLSNAKDAANKLVGPQSHEDLAKKLQEELERNRKASSGSKSDGSGRSMKEVACPTCTVHLQVQVPTSGSETIECGVCQHPFLVSAH